MVCPSPPLRASVGAFEREAGAFEGALSRGIFDIGRAFDTVGRSVFEEILRTEAEHFGPIALAACFRGEGDAELEGPGFRRYVISGATPFLPEDATRLSEDAPAVLAQRAPALAAAFAARGWQLPRTVDRVYDSRRAQAELGWRPRYGFEEVLAELDRGSPEVLSA